MDNVISYLQVVSKWDKRFLELAKHVSTWSKDPSTQVGAVIARDKRIISLGFNGFPQKMFDHKEHYENRDEKYPRIVHGEMNAYRFAEQSVEGCTLYTYPFMPCDRCFVFQVQAGIARFVFPKATPDQESRWGAAFEKVRQYAKDCNVPLIEVSE